MLESIHLDTEGFEEIFRRARSQISEIYPSWNNYNYHDPGITILELMAFLKEAQHFHLDHISEESFEAYLRLWGIERRKSCGAEISATIHGDRQVKIGQRFEKNHLTFETTEAFQPVDSVVKGLLTAQGKLETQSPIYPFGKKPKVGDSFYILLKESLLPEHNYHLSLQFSKGLVERNPIPDLRAFLPLVTLAFSYYDGTKERLIPVEDETAGFLQDGTLSFTLDSFIAPRTLGDSEEYAIKITLEEGQYDASPAMTELSFSQCRLVQQKTLASFFPVEELENYSQKGKELDYYRQSDGCYALCEKEEASHISLYDTQFQRDTILGIGNGFPQQSFEVHRESFLSKSLGVLVKNILDDKYRLYEEVEDFGASDPLSPHYKVLEEEQKILFGDGRHGFPPETEIRIVSLALSQSEEGNVALGTVLESAPGEEGAVSVDSLLKPGQKRESLNSALERLNTAPMEALVTSKDYENCIRNTPGLKIAQCKVLEDGSEDASVSVVVRPGDGALYLSQKYKDNIQKHCQDKLLLGTKLKLRSPSYTEIDVYGEIQVRAEYRNAKESIASAIKAYFHDLESFGAVVEYSDVYRRIESLECVSQLRSLHLAARGDGILRKRNGDVLSPKTSVTILKDMQLHIVS